jgi:hypothetical protein
MLPVTIKCFSLLKGASADPGSGEMHLLPEPLFTIPTDNTFIMHIVGTNIGRIFMAGKDGCLYEIIYQVGNILNIQGPSW